jgi:hypothetical protein
MLTRLQRMVLLEGPIYGHLHVLQLCGREGDRTGFPFYATTRLGALGFTRTTTSTTVSADRNGVKLCRTVWCHSLTDSDSFESQRLTE